MKKVLVIILFVLSTAFVAGSYVSSFREFRQFPLEKLESERIEYNKVINSINEKIGIEGGNSEDLQIEYEQRSKTLRAIEREILIKKYKLDPLAVFIIFLAILYFVVSKFKKKLVFQKTSTSEILDDLEVSEIAPRELYVDEWEYQKRIESGFRTKREAIEWLRADPTLKCDYCGNRLRPTMTGKPQAVQLMTFYKEVPEGAADMRVVLGTFWFALPANELKCSGCSRLVHR